MAPVSIKNNLFSLLKLAIPLASTGVVQSSAFFLETFFLAHLSKDALAAGALVSWLLATIIAIFFGTLSSINVLVAHKHGANDQSAIAHIARDGLMMAVIFSIPIFILCWNMAPIFLFFGQTNIVVSLAQSYLHALSWSIAPNFMMIALLELIVGLGHARTVMIFSMLNVSLNIVFSYLLIFGKCGFPQLGIAGAGWGTSIGDIVTFIILSIYILTQEKYRIYFSAIFTFKKPFFLWELIQIGVPIGLMYCVEVGFFFVLTLMMGSFGAVFLAANQIAMQYLGLLMSMIFSIAQAITVRMGHLLGAKEYKSANQAAILGVSISGSLMFLIGLIFWLFPSFLISIDFNIGESKNQELVHYATQLLLVSPLFQILESMRISLFGVLRALKDTRFTLLTSIFSFWCIALPMGYLLATQLNMMGSGFWWGMVLGAAVSVVILSWRYKVKITSIHALI